METLLARKRRPSLDVEPLEARCVRSRIGVAPGWPEAPGTAGPASVVSLGESHPAATTLAREPADGSASSGTPVWTPTGAPGAGPFASWAGNAGDAGVGGTVPPAWVGSGSWTGGRSPTVADATSPADPLMSRGFDGPATSTGAAWNLAGRTGAPLAAPDRLAAAAAAAATSTPAPSPGAPAGEPSQADARIAGPAVALPSPRAVAAAPFVRPMETPATSRGEGTTLARSTPGASPGLTASSASPADAAIPGVGLGGPAPDGPAGGAATPVPAVIVGNEGPISPAQPAPDGGTQGGDDARPYAAARPPAGPSIGDGDGGGAGAGREGDAGVAPAPRRDPAAPAPELAGMITSLVPAGRRTIEAALDQLLEPFDGLGPSITRLATPLGLLATSLAVGISLLVQLGSSHLVE